MDDIVEIHDLESLAWLYSGTELVGKVQIQGRDMRKSANQVPRLRLPSSCTSLIPDFATIIGP